MAGGNNLDESFGISVLPVSTALITGDFWGIAMFGLGESDDKTLTSAGFLDIFIAKFVPPHVCSRRLDVILLTPCLSSRFKKQARIKNIRASICGEI